MLRRRAQYGTSEAVLHALHPDKRKRFPLAPVPLATVALVSAALVRLEPRLLPLCLAPAFGTGLRRRSRLRRSGVELPEAPIWTSVLRGHISMLYFAYFHLTRYYLGPLTVAGAAAPGLGVGGGGRALFRGGRLLHPAPAHVLSPTWPSIWGSTRLPGGGCGGMRPGGFVPLLHAGVRDARVAPVFAGARQPFSVRIGSMIRGEKIYLTELDWDNSETIRAWINDPEVHKYLARVTLLSARSRRAAVL